MRLFGRVDKSWGYEEIFISNDMYCAKYLVFDRLGGSTSMHFHKEKHETWTVVQGSFLVKYIETDTANVREKILRPVRIDSGYRQERFTIEPLVPHQLISLEANSIMLEISTPDSVEDNYRLYR